MLVLSRRNGEEIQLRVGGGRIIIRVLNLGERRVRLGIDAPEQVEILRGELVKQTALFSEVAQST